MSRRMSDRTVDRMSEYVSDRTSEYMWDKRPDGMPVIMSDKMLDNITGFIPFWGSHTQF